MPNENDISNGLVKYGELVILGHNGVLEQGEKGRKRSKFVLYKRFKANGVRRSRDYFVAEPQCSKAILDANLHSISYTLSRTSAVIVEYSPDPDTDMFQLGRSSEGPIDFVVMDIVPGDRRDKANPHPTQSTISRFACRIFCERNNPQICRIYAAGFDSSRNIFLGEKAIKWLNEDKIMDGLTTNGVLIAHPNGSFLGNGQHDPYRVWREVSVGGQIFSLRETRSMQKCGVKINAGRPQCPVGLNTLVIPRTQNNSLISLEKQPYVYLNCGHVQGLHDWGHVKDSEKHTCPICLKVGPIVKLSFGIEAAFWIDAGTPTHCFHPCGHMTSEATAKYWDGTPIPHGTNGFHAACPFCAVPLEATPGYVRLIFQDHLD